MRRTSAWKLFLYVLVVLALTALLTACNKVRVPDGFSRVTLVYNGADNAPETDVKVVEKGEVVSLPELTKEGYGFVGWKYDSLTLRSSVVAKEKRMTLEAVFARDYSVYSSPCVLFTDNGGVLGFREGKYEKVTDSVSEIYVKGGYKVVVYARKNLKGKATTIAYREKTPLRNVYNGRIRSMEVKKVETEVAATYDEEEGVTDALKAELLKTFAPRFYWAEGEEFFASSVEEAKGNLTRSASEKGFFYEVAGLKSADYVDDFLRGDLGKAKVYAFAVEKERTYLDLTYFVYCPYNYGKKIAGKAFGNHVGDWEHVTVRLLVEEETRSLRPVMMEFSAHSFRFYLPYDEVEKEEGHPVAYIAKQSHGIWSGAGEHTYVNALVLKLKDETSKGIKWDAWNALETYSYDALTFTGKGIGGSEWNTCFDKTYNDENSNAVIQWGNNKLKSLFYPRLDNGPTGPQEKPVLCNYYALNDPEEFIRRI